MQYMKRHLQTILFIKFSSRFQMHKCIHLTDDFANCLFKLCSNLKVQRVKIKNAAPWVLFFHVWACIYPPEINSQFVCKINREYVGSQSTYSILAATLHIHSEMLIRPWRLHPAILLVISSETNSERLPLWWVPHNLLKMSPQKCLMCPRAATKGTQC